MVEGVTKRDTRFDSIRKFSLSYSSKNYKIIGFYETKILKNFIIVKTEVQIFNRFTSRFDAIK